MVFVLFYNRIRVWVSGFDCFIIVVVFVIFKVLFGNIFELLYLFLKVFDRNVGNFGFLVVYLCCIIKLVFGGYLEDVIIMFFVFIKCFIIYLMFLRILFYLVVTIVV